MKFESFSGCKEEYMEREITPNIKQTTENTFESQINIDGLKYCITLNRKPTKLFKSKDWSLAFDVEGTNALTNKGFSVFNILVDRIEELVQAVCSIERIEKIGFMASSTKSKYEDVATFTNLLQEKFITSPENFEGFECDVMGSKTAIIGKFTIRDNKAIKTLFNHKLLGVPEKEEVSIKEFLQNNAYVNSLLEGRLNGQKLLDYLDIAHSIPEYDYDKKDGSEARMKLYKRILERKFPQYLLENKGGMMVIHINKQ